MMYRDWINVTFQLKKKKEEMIGRWLRDKKRLLMKFPSWASFVISVLSFGCAVIYLQYISFWLFTTCEGTTSTSSGFRFLIFGDSHLLGMRRSWWDRNWVDWQVRRSVEFAIWKHNPTDLIFLGDLFDEGKHYDSKTLVEESQRFVSTIVRPSNRSNVRLHTIAGNHDIGEHYQLRASKIEAFQKAIGTVNVFHKDVCVEEEEEEEGECVSILGINTMALEGTPFDKDVKTSTENFISQVETKRQSTTNKNPLILLTHLPMFREDDTKCGLERSRETGHVTYGHPSKKMRQKSDVLSQTTSKMLFNRFKPSLILSAHTHAVCRHSHDDNDVLEMTTSAFGWRMRPDPGYLFLSFRNDPSQLDSSLYCKLPHERVSIAISVTFCVISGLFAVLGVILLMCFGRIPRAVPSSSKDR